jgi:regulator of protease activity HflC (stomatin/prohibitin superfamily)
VEPFGTIILLYTLFSAVGVAFVVIMQLVRRCGPLLLKYGVSQALGKAPFGMEARGLSGTLRGQVPVFGVRTIWDTRLGTATTSASASLSTLARRRTPTHFGFVIVPQQYAYIVQRFGRFSRVLEPGLHFLIPLVDKIAYTHSLKEEAVSINSQTAITRDNVTIAIDGVLYVRVVDPAKASYGVEDPYMALTLLAQTTMRSELGKLSLDKTFEEREMLNSRIVDSINEAAAAWGMQCLRYEIRDINPPANVRKAMELQAEAERRKRAQILDSEGEKESEINVAEGQKRAKILNSEALQLEQINRAHGEAEAMLARARATAQAIRIVAAEMQQKGGRDAVALRIAEQYVQAWSKLAKEGNTLIIPANLNDVRGMITQAFSIWETLGNQTSNAPAARAVTPSAEDKAALVASSEQASN